MGTLSVTCVGFLESIGTTELLVILVVALVVFGPRKLPEMGRMLGRSLSEFRSASEDFKRTWEHAADAGQRGPTVRAALPELEQATHSVAAADAAPVVAAVEEASATA